jgi:hypothetical protein
MQMRGGEELLARAAGAVTVGAGRGGGGGIESETDLGGGDSDGVSELRIELQKETQEHLR